jgi:arginase
VPGFYPVSPEATFLLGARDLDPPEDEFLAGSTITSAPVSQIPARLPELLASSQLDDALGYIHLDLDVLDPRVGQANSLPVRGGLTVGQLTDAIAAVRSRVQLGAAAITSYAPESDVQHGVCRAAFAALDAILADGA